MYVEEKASPSDQPLEHEDMLAEVERALESAGVPGNLRSQITASLKTNGNGSGDEPAAAPRSDRQTAITDNALVILEQRYLRKDAEGKPIETPEDLFHRVANAIAEGEQPAYRTVWANRFYDVMTSLKFLPNSPTLVNAGTSKGCLSACFVASPEDDMESIMQVAHDAAMIEKWGGGIGFGFSKLRPKNDKIRTTHGNACGPIAVMKLYSAVGATLTQGAFRLGAHMGQLRDSHPDIREFITCKDDDETLRNFNISVQITDAFMEAVKADAQWALVNPRDEGTGPVDDVVEMISARELWEEIAESAWKTGDPGVVFMDRVWETAPNPQLGRIETSNPCGEEFLENYGNCCLGSINLDNHVGQYGLDWDGLEETIRTAVRFLDDVIEVNSFPLPKLREVNLATRRIGLGYMGWADALVRLGLPYDSAEAQALAQELGGFVERIAWDESHNLAVERGPFPEYENSDLKARGLPPVRNSSVITIAPTGTISRIAGCSSGIEPHFALAWWSNVLWQNPDAASSRLLDAPASIRETLADHLGDDEAVKRVLERIAESPDDAAAILGEHGLDPAVFRSSMAISAEAHVRMQAAWQEHVTNSVSKTINLPNSATVADVKAAFELAWETGCKAVTVYRDGSKSMQVLETGKDEEEAEPVAGLLVPRQRPTSVVSVTDRVRTGHGNMYVSISFDETGKPFEVFANVGKAGGCDSANLEAVTRLISLALRSGIDPDVILEQLHGITCCPAWDEGTLIRSAPDGVGHALSHHVSVASSSRPDQSTYGDVDSAAQLGLFPPTGTEEQPANGGVRPRTGYRCPKCSGTLIPQEGCLNCIDCGFSKCE
tara:strand:+ start:12907 stop:15408 length:2502 start_codon:yes stop_codon:yes gene_type:complete